MDEKKEEERTSQQDQAENPQNLVDNQEELLKSKLESVEGEELENSGEGNNSPSARGSS